MSGKEPQTGGTKDDQRNALGGLYGSLPTDIDGVQSLAELALDMRWSWNHAAHELWSQLDSVLWDLTHNPWVVLQTVSRDQLDRACADPDFRYKIESLVAAKRQSEEAPGWFQERKPDSGLTCIAYFSMEFMLSEALPIYSGGLGNVAGDQLKAASDLGVPVVGVGLLYQQGYFRQVISKSGAQEALYPYNDPGQLPISQVRTSNGEWMRMEIKLPGYSVWLRVWQVQVGRLKLYLLDSNDAANYPAYRGITSELYGGDTELRLKQEMLLGIGGWRMLRALGLQPEVCHLNEGHAAFAVLERARHFMKETGQPFNAALAATRAGNIFTTHTAVPAGFDRFSPAVIAHHLGVYADGLGISVDQLLALGRRNPQDSSEPFNMAYLAIRGSGAVNGVSSLHGEVSRRIFAPLFERWPEDEVPVGHITNGVHVPSWESEAADALWTKVVGVNRWRGSETSVEQGVHGVTDAQLWELRTTNRTELVEFARKRLAMQLAVRGEPAESIERAKAIFRDDVLTIGFARRFASYKRPNLLLTDPDRLLRLLCDSERPVQLVIAGKAHPADQTGMALIQRWIEFIARPEARPHVIFLSDYDMLLAEHLVRGVDVWVNTPRRPWEASGTSGMKILVNGGINLSELDGWWAEAYANNVGWALGDGQEHDESDEVSLDAAEADALYTLLEHEVIPQFYSRNGQGVAAGWVARMRESMAMLTPRFSADRAVREYVERHYLPAAAAYRTRSLENGAAGRDLIEWQQELDSKWVGLRFGEVKSEVNQDEYRFTSELFLNGIDSNSVRVELYADPRGGESAETWPMKVEQEHSSTPNVSEGASIYTASVPNSRPASEITVRVIPYREGLQVPLEDAHILWQK